MRIRHIRLPGTAPEPTPLPDAGWHLGHHPRTRAGTPRTLNL